MKLDIDPESEAVKPENEAVKSKSEALNLESEAVSLQNEAFNPAGAGEPYHADATGRVPPSGRRCPPTGRASPPTACLGFPNEINDFPDAGAEGGIQRVCLWGQTPGRTSFLPRFCSDLARYLPRGGRETVQGQLGKCAKSAKEPSLTVKVKE